MSNAIVQALEDAATKVGRAIEDAVRSVGHFFDDTASRLETAAKNHVEHDGRAASELENAGRHADETPTVHGAGGASTTPASSPGVGGADAGGEVDRIAQFSQKVQRGYEAKSTDPRTSGQFPSDYQPMQGMNAEQYIAKYSDGTWNQYGSPNWAWEREAPNNGASGPELDHTLSPGDVVDRYGYDGGKYLSPDGTSYPQRGLPAENLAHPYTRYVVVKPLPTHAGAVAPAFGEPGGGLQFRTDQSVADLLRDGYLRKVHP